MDIPGDSVRCDLISDLCSGLFARATSTFKAKADRFSYVLRYNTYQYTPHKFSDSYLALPATRLGRDTPRDTRHRVLT